MAPILLYNTIHIDAISMGADITPTTPINLSDAHHYSVQAVWSGGSPVGNILIECSLDDVTYTNLATQAAGGAAGSYIFNASNVSYIYLRVRYVRGSDTGTLSVRVAAKRN